MIYKIGIAFSIAFGIFIINLVRKNKLEEKYSIVWIFFSICILIISIFHNFIMNLAIKVGVFYPPTLLLLLTLIVEGIYIVHLTIVITLQNKREIRIIQELSILDKKIMEMENKNNEQ